jgi:hypothetical protein
MNETRPFDPQDREAIAQRAYELWQRRGCPQGSAESDWYEAEAQLRAERLSRLEATRLFDPPAPVELEPPQLAGEAPEEAAAPKRRRRSPAASASSQPSTGTRVTRRRPARPDA